MIIDIPSYSMQRIKSILDPSLVWLPENIGNYVAKFALSPPREGYSFNEPSELLIDWQTLVDVYRKKTGQENDPFRIMWYQGAGWDIFKTIHYEVYDKNYMRNVYHLFIVIPDDILAVQFKLAVL